MNSMDFRRWLGYPSSAVCLAVSSFCMVSQTFADTTQSDVLEAESETCFVFVRPEKSSYWHTSKGGEVSLPVPFPKGATTARLSVSGIGYSALYENITADEFRLTLPEAVSPETEDVYSLALEFDDNTAITTRVGVIQGLLPGSEGAAACRPTNGNAWRRVQRRAVLPIPYGTDSLNVNGKPADTGLNGAQGWFAIDKIGGRERTSLALAVGEDTYESWIRGAVGLAIAFR